MIKIANLVPVFFRFEPFFAHFGVGCPTRTFLPDDCRKIPAFKFTGTGNLDDYYFVPDTITVFVEVFVWNEGAKSAIFGDQFPILKKASLKALVTTLHK